MCRSVETRISHFYKWERFNRDIERNFDEWVYWEWDEENMEDGESKDRKLTLQQKIDELKELL